MVVTWLLTSTYSDSRSKCQDQDITKAHGVNSGQRQGLAFHHSLKVGSCVLGLLLGVLQLLLQVGRLLLLLARHDHFDALDFTRGCDFGLQLCFMGCGGLRVSIRRLSQKTSLSLCPLGKRLHNKQSRSFNPMIF
jgi:hypothetical protein